MKTTPFLKTARTVRRLLVGAALTVVLFLIPTAALSDDGSFGILVPANSTPFGMTFGEWSARWWQWAFTPPTTEGPADWPNETNPDCSFGQLGPVWFLMGYSPGPVTISCHIPFGKALFFPIINVECSSLEDGTPFDGETPPARHQCAQQLIDDVVALKATIDGRSIKNLSKNRAQSPDFNFTVPPPPNFLGLPVVGFGQSAADGYYLMPILFPGHHTIHFFGEIQSSSIGDFKIDTTYELTVDR